MVHMALMAQAYVQRVQLWSDGLYATPALSWDKNALQGRPFYCYAYGAPRGDREHALKRQAQPQ